MLDGYLLEGGENSQFHMVELNRDYTRTAWSRSTRSWSSTLRVGTSRSSRTWPNRDQEMSIENSVAVSGTTVYFANSGGLVSGWDLAPLVDGTGEPERTFRFWTGDDTDASIVIDAEGFLYVSVEYERGNERAAEVGQLMKLDPRSPDDPLVWSYDDRVAATAGFWGTAALHRDVVINATNAGKLLALECADRRGALEHRPGRTDLAVTGVVEDTLVYGDCNGTLRATTSPTRRRHRRCCGRSSSAAASSRRPRSGADASSSGPVLASSSP